MPPTQKLRSTRSGAGTRVVFIGVLYD
jgi:hypothetical protein